jgi:hypothetical protein
MLQPNLDMLQCGMRCRPLSNGMWVATWPVLLALGWSCRGCGHIASGTFMAVVGLWDAHAKRLERSTHQQAEAQVDCALQLLP